MAILEEANIGAGVAVAGGSSGVGGMGGGVKR
jgi:hypothetical protein